MVSSASTDPLQDPLPSSSPTTTEEDNNNENDCGGSNSADDHGSLQEEVFMMSEGEDEEVSVDQDIPTEVAFAPSISAQSTTATHGDNEKEEFISDRHEFISRILDHCASRASATSETGTTTPAAVANNQSTSQMEGQQEQQLEGGGGGRVGVGLSVVLALGEGDSSAVLSLSTPQRQPLTLPPEKAGAHTSSNNQQHVPSSAQGEKASSHNSQSVPTDLHNPGAFYVTPGEVERRRPHEQFVQQPQEDEAEESTTSMLEVQVGQEQEQEQDVLDLEQGVSSCFQLYQEDAASVARTNATEVPGSSMDLTVPIEAEAVDVEEQRAQMEQEIRQAILQETVQAAQVEIVVNDNAVNRGGDDIDNDRQRQQQQSGTRDEGRTKAADSKGKLHWKRQVFWGIAFAVIAVALVLGLAMGLSRKNGDTTTTVEEEEAGAAVDALSSLSTLEQVRQRGYVRCGMTEFAFATFASSFDVVHSKDVFSHGFNVEQCKAMALLALGDPTKYEQVQCDHYTRFSFLANGTIDVMTEGATHTMQRDVYLDLDSFQSGFAFTDPYFYSGLSFAGEPRFVECADNLDSFYEHCRNLRICVLDGSTHIQVLRELIPGSAVVAYNGTEQLMPHLFDGTCNVAAGEPLYLLQIKKLYLEGFNNEDVNSNNNRTESEIWKFGTRIASKEPLAVVTRNDDPEWSALANVMVNGLILAEANNVTKENAHEITNLFLTGNAGDDDLSSLVLSLVSTFGNYGDLYQQEIESLIPRGNALNRPYDKYQTTGLLYAMPFGDISNYGPDPIANGTLDVAAKRGYLICGIQSRGPAFARKNDTDWAGFDVEICRGIAGSLFAGDSDRIEFVEMNHSQQSYAALAAEEVDVVAGARVNLQAQYREPVTGRGYTFSPRYYFDNDTKEGYAFMTRSNDVQWNEFVYWMVMAIIFAEEQGITSQVSADMPVVTMFGDALKQAFRDCISSIGSYAELYNNTLEEFIPRAGANRLNEQNRGAQMFPIPPY